jgi:hypothetical protein
MPRFSLKRLLLSAICVSIGIGGYVSMLRFRDNFHGIYFWPALLGCLTFYALIGAGTLAPFGRAKTGAILGPIVGYFVIPLLISAFYLILYILHPVT